MSLENIPGNSTLHLDYKDVAEKYGGNIQRIAQAAATGVLGPYGVLVASAAADHIKRMRAAAAQEQAPQQTVAQQLLSPQPQTPPQGQAPTPPMPQGAPPAGLGAIPPAAPPMGMPQGMPAMGMARGGSVGPKQDTPDTEEHYNRYRLPHNGSRDDHHFNLMEALRQLTGGGAHHQLGHGDIHARYNPFDKQSDYGVDYPISDHTGLFAGAGGRGVIPNEVHIGMRHEFADGGMVAPYASGGLSDLPVPDTMFDEPSNGGFAGGGIVAFAEAGSVGEDPMPDTFYGYNYKDPLANAAMYEKLFGTPQTKYSDAAEQDYLTRQGEAYKKRRSGKSAGQLAAELGFGWASGDSPYALVNFAKAAIPAIANASEREKEARAEDREVQRGLLDIEQGRNTAAAQKAANYLQMQGIGIKGAEDETNRRFQASENQKQRDFDWKKLLTTEAGENARAALRAANDGSDKFNMSADDVVIPGRRRGDRDTVITRLRATQRGGTGYGYIFPDLGNTVINPAHGQYGLGVRNAIKYFGVDKLRFSPTRRLQYVRDGKIYTIPDDKMKKLDDAGINFDPKKFKY